MKRNMFLIPFLVLLSGCSATGHYETIKAEEALKMMAETGGYQIVDVRRADEYAEVHVKGAINIPNETIGSEKIAELPDKDQLIFVYCRSGNRSHQAAEKLAKQGYTKIYDFGAIASWPGEFEK